LVLLTFTVSVVTPAGTVYTPPTGVRMMVLLPEV